MVIVFDASMIAAAISSNSTVLYTEDLRDGQQIETVTIRNPFRDGVDTTALTEGRSVPSC